MKFSIPSYGSVTTGSPTKIALVAATIKTVLQFKPLIACKIIEWGISFDGSAAAVPGLVELIDTGTVAATVTALASADVGQMDAEARLINANSTYMTFSTTGSGFNASGEGSITATNPLAPAQLIAPTNQFLQQFPLGEQPFLLPSNLCRIRCNFPAIVNLTAYLKVSYGD